MEVSHENATAFAKEFAIRSLFYSLPTSCRHQAALEECRIAFSRRKLKDAEVISYGLVFVTKRRYCAFQKRALETLRRIDELLSVIPS
jgi:hypothetical protein